MNQIDFDKIWYTLKFLVFFNFLDCGYTHVHVVVYGQKELARIYEKSAHLANCSQIFKKSFKSKLLYH